MKRFAHELATPSQTEATAATAQDINIVPRRAKYLFRGSVSQQPSTAQARYGAPTMRPVRLATMFFENRSVVTFSLCPLLAMHVYIRVHLFDLYLP